MDKKSVQFMLAYNKHQIQFLEAHIEHYRQRKTNADEQGYLEVEYESHDALKYLRKEMKKFVAAQKQLKKLMKA